MAIEELDITTGDIVAGQKIYAQNEIDRINEILAWANDQVADKAIAKDGSAAMEAALDMGTNKINNVVDPIVDQDAATKKYVDDTITTGHDGDGYGEYDINNVKTKVYTKYLTGTLDADASTSVAHGVTGIDNILAVDVAVYNDSSTNYSMDNRYSNLYNAGDRWLATYDGTNIDIIGVGANVQGNNYRIRIDYT